MSDISEQLLDALIALPAVESLWLLPNNRRGSHFSRADEDLLIVAPSVHESEWQQAMDLVSLHEKWHLISVFKLDQLPEADATKVRPH